MITVIGLGLNGYDLTLRAAEIIKTANKVFIKTAKTPTYKYFTDNNINTVSFDDLYEEAEDFKALNDKIIDTLTAETEDVVFCVNGAGGDDGTVMELQKVADIEIVRGVGGADLAASYCPDTSYSCYSAYDAVSSKAFMPDKRHAVVIKEIDNKYLAGDLKIILQDLYGDDKDIIMVEYVEKTDKLTYTALADLDRQQHYSYATSVILPPENFMTAKRHGFTDLIEIMENLLGENGCPWDRSQTHESIRINLIEEAYELVDAIDRDDLDGMIEESGDVLLQAVFHCMLGKADGEYDVYDATTGLCNKLIKRHTHIFGDKKAASAEEALKCWTAAKNVEKKYVDYSDKMDKLPKNLPALLYAYKMQKIAVKCGFDWRDIDGTFDKLDEEIDEFKKADGDEAVMEAGDVLFSAVNPMRWKGIEPEMALRASCDKFLKRFKYMEENIKNDGLDLSDEATREKYWAEAKKLYK